MYHNKDCCLIDPLALPMIIRPVIVPGQEDPADDVRAQQKDLLPTGPDVGKVKYKMLLANVRIMPAKGITPTYII